MTRQTQINSCANEALIWEVISVTFEAYLRNLSVCCVQLMVQWKHDEKTHQNIMNKDLGNKLRGIAVLGLPKGRQEQ